MERAAAYFDAVQLYELVDIHTAVRNFLSGSAPGHNPAYAPSAPLVGAEVRRVMNLRLDSEARTKLPELPPPAIKRTPEEIARVEAMVKAVVERNAAIMRTEDAEKDRRARELAARTNERFKPDMTPAAMKRRLGFSVGDPDGDRDVA